MTQTAAFHLRLPADLPDELLSDVHQAIADVLAEALPGGDYDLRDSPFPEPTNDVEVKALTECKDCGVELTREDGDTEWEQVGEETVCPDSEDGEHVPDLTRVTATLVCPVCGGEDCIVERNVAEVWSDIEEAEADEDGDLVAVTIDSPTSGDFEGAGFVCTSCTNAVDLPAGVEQNYS